MALPVTISGISTAVAPLGPFKNNIEIGQMPATAPTGAQTGPIGSGVGGTATKVGCTFTTVSANSITDVTLELEILAGAPTDGVICEIYATSGGLPTGTALGASTAVPASALTTSYALTKFTFATPVAVSSGTVYAAVMSRTGAASGTDYYGFRMYNTPNGTTLGIQNTGSWATITGMYPRFFVGTTNANYYFFGADSASNQVLKCFKAASGDPTSSWAATTSVGRGSSSQIYAIAGAQIGNIVHTVVSADNGASVSIEYAQYDLATETTVGSAEFVASGLVTTGQTGASVRAASIVVRSTSEVVVFFNGAQTKTGGTNRARVYYSRRTAANTWSAAVEVDASGAADTIGPVAVLGTADTVHFLFGETGTVGIHQRALNSSNALQTQTNASVTSGPTHAGMAYVNGANVQCVYTMTSTGTGTAASSGAFTSSATTPTPVSATGYSGNTLNSIPSRPFVDGTTIYFLGLGTSTSDLYVVSSTNNGATVGSATLAFTGTVAVAATNLSLNGAIYQRGNDVVIPYIVNDGGTLKYNEYVVRSLVTPTVTPSDLPYFSAWSDGDFRTEIVSYG